MDVGSPCGALDASRSRPLAAPTLSLDRRLLTEGDELGGARTTRRTTVTRRSSVIPEGGTAAEAIESTTVIRDERQDTSFSTAELEPAGYDIVMTDADGNETRSQLVLGEVTGGRRVSHHRQGDLRRRRADRGLVGRRPGQPVGLDRRLRGAEAPDPEEGRLPALGLHRWARGRRPAAHRSTDR